MDALRRRTAARLAAIVGLSEGDLDDLQPQDEASVPIEDVAADAGGPTAATPGSAPGGATAATPGSVVGLGVRVAFDHGWPGLDRSLGPSPQAIDDEAALSATAEAAPAPPVAVDVLDDDAPLASSRGADRAAPASPASVPDEPAAVATLIVAQPVILAPASSAATPIALPANAVAVMAEAARPAAAVGAKANLASPASATTPRASRPRSAKPTATGGNAASRKRRKPPVTLLPAACPTCGHLLAEVPSTTRRCVECRQRILVKRIDGRVVLVAGAVGALFDAERRRLLDGERIKRDCGRWLQMAALAGAAPEVLEARAQAVAARPTHEAVTAARTLYATTVDRACRAARRLHEWQTVADLRWRQARAYHRAAGATVPPEASVVALHREGIEASLRHIAELARDAELSGGQCCEACKAETGRVARISVELKASSLPHADCPAGLCGCRWDVPAERREALAKLSRRRATPPTPRPKAKSAG